MRNTISRMVILTIRMFCFCLIPDQQEILRASSVVAMKSVQDQTDSSRTVDACQHTGGSPAPVRDLQTDSDFIMFPDRAMEILMQTDLFVIKIFITPHLHGRSPRYTIMRPIKKLKNPSSPVQAMTRHSDHDFDPNIGRS